MTETFLDLQSLVRAHAPLKPKNMPVWLLGGPSCLFRPPKNLLPQVTRKDNYLNLCATMVSILCPFSAHPTAVSPPSKNTDPPLPVPLLLWQSLPPPTPGPRQLSIESVTLQKLVEQLQRKALPQITDGGVDSVTLERPAVRIVVRGHGDDFCGWPGCASLFRIENRFDKERAMDVHDRNHLDMSPRTVSVFVPYPVKNHDRMRISAAIQVASALWLSHLFC